ncbi:MAG: hypothetical protein IT530_01805 [Burkholderiales bacterium]|nr:hypothetical protein [Burkholderiales bacterium]
MPMASRASCPNRPAARALGEARHVARMAMSHDPSHCASPIRCARMAIPSAPVPALAIDLAIRALEVAIEVAVLVRGERIALLAVGLAAPLALIAPAVVATLRIAVPVALSHDQSIARISGLRVRGG